MASIIPIDSQVYIKIFLELIVEVDTHEADIGTNIELVAVEWSTTVLLKSSNASDIAFVSEYSQLKTDVWISVCCIIFNFECSFGSRIHLERVPAFLQDINLKETSILLFVFHWLVYIRRIVVYLGYSDYFELLAENFIRHKKYSVILKRVSELGFCFLIYKFPVWVIICPSSCIFALTPWISKLH